MQNKNTSMRYFRVRDCVCYCLLVLVAVVLLYSLSMKESNTAGYKPLHNHENSNKEIKLTKNGNRINDKSVSVRSRKFTNESGRDNGLETDVYSFLALDKVWICMYIYHFPERFYYLRFLTSRFFLHIFIQALVLTSKRVKVISLLSSQYAQ